MVVGFVMPSKVYAFSNCAAVAVCRQLGLRRRSVGPTAAEFALLAGRMRMRQGLPKPRELADIWMRPWQFSLNLPIVSDATS